MSVDEKIKRANKLINKLIFEACNFIWYAAFQYGAHDYLLAGEKNEVDGNIIEPKKLKVGKDKDYYYDFYEYLCRYAHCNYGVINDYLDDKYCYTTERNNNPLLTRLFVIFVFTRLFEHVVTVEGEEFLNERTEKKCYKLVEESLLFQNEVFTELIEVYSKPIDNENLKHKQKWMREMLKKMRKALSEEVGSVGKDFLK